MLSHEQIAACVIQAHDRWNASADTLNQWSDLGYDEQHALIARAIETAVRIQATNDTLNAMRQCEQRSGTCVMVHSILCKEHPDLCNAENCESIRAMKVPT